MLSISAVTIALKTTNTLLNMASATYQNSLSCNHYQNNTGYRRPYKWAMKAYNIYTQ